MSTPRISASNYSNSAPLIWSFLYGSNRGKYEMILDNAPARSAQMLAENRVDAALVPVIAYQLIDNIALIPDVCVGAKERVRSVCLVTRGAELKDVKSVSLDISSKTSLNLTKIIFSEFLSTDPIYTPAKPNLEEMLDESDAALLIGDPALMIDEAVFRKFDLAELWKSFTGFGFVFAMFMAPADKAEAAKKIDFRAAKDEGVNHIDEIIANYEGHITLPREEFRKYLLENISYAVDDTMHKGMELYFALAHKNGLIDRVKPLEFI